MVLKFLTDGASMIPKENEEIVEKTKNTFLKHPNGTKAAKADKRASNHNKAENDGFEDANYTCRKILVRQALPQ